MTTIARDPLSFRRGILLTLRNRIGLTREEARRVFNQFRRRVPGEKSGREPEVPEPGHSPDMGEVARYMHETNQRLEHIEKDLDYLKRQVDRILDQM